MGHSRLGEPPRTRKWAALVGTVSGPTGVAGAVLDAAERGLAAAHKDAGAVEAVRLLVFSAIAARVDDFAVDPGGRGVKVDYAPGLVDVLAAVAARVDGATPGNRSRTDRPRSAGSQTRHPYRAT